MKVTNMTISKNVINILLTFVIVCGCFHNDDENPIVDNEDTEEVLVSEEKQSSNSKTNEIEVDDENQDLKDVIAEENTTSRDSDVNDLNSNLNNHTDEDNTIGIDINIDIKNSADKDKKNEDESNLDSPEDDISNDVNNNLITGSINNNDTIKNDSERVDSESDTHNSSNIVNQENNTGINNQNNNSGTSDTHSSSNIVNQENNTGINNQNNNSGTSDSETRSKPKDTEVNNRNIEVIESVSNQSNASEIPVSSTQVPLNEETNQHAPKQVSNEIIPEKSSFYSAWQYFVNAFKKKEESNSMTSSKNIKVLKKKKAKKCTSLLKVLCAPVALVGICCGFVYSNCEGYGGYGECYMCDDVDCHEVSLYQMLKFDEFADYIQDKHSNGFRDIPNFNSSEAVDEKNDVNKELLTQSEHSSDFVDEYDESEVVDEKNDVSKELLTQSEHSSDFVDEYDEIDELQESKYGQQIGQLEHDLGECNVEWGSCKQSRGQKDRLDERRIEDINKYESRFNLCNEQLKKYEKKEGIIRQDRNKKVKIKEESKHIDEIDEPEAMAIHISTQSEDVLNLTRKIFKKEQRTKSKRAKYEQRIDLLKQELESCNEEWNLCKQEIKQRDELDIERLKEIGKWKDEFSSCNNQLKKYKKRAKINRQDSSIKYGKVEDDTMKWIPRKQYYKQQQDRDIR